MGIVRSSNGDIEIDDNGEILDDPEDSAGGIIRFDLDEYKRTYGELDPSGEYDILDLGYWYNQSGKELKYEGPDLTFRSEFRKGPQSDTPSDPVPRTQGSFDFMDEADVKRHRSRPMSEVIRTMLSESSGQASAVQLIEQYRMQRGDTRLRGAIASTLWHEAELALHARNLTEELKPWLAGIQQGRIDEAMDSVPENLRESWKAAFSKAKLHGLAAFISVE